MSRILVIDDDVHIGNILEELLARVAAALRKSAPAGNAVLTHGPIRLDGPARRVCVDGAEVRLRRILPLRGGQPGQKDRRLPPADGRGGGDPLHLPGYVR